MITREKFQIHQEFENLNGAVYTSTVAMYPPARREQTANGRFSGKQKQQNIVGRFISFVREQLQWKRPAAVVTQLAPSPSEWVSNISHDLKTPLASIQLSLDLLEKMGPLTESQTSVLRRLKSSSHEMDNLINDILSLEKMNGDTPLQTMAVSLPRQIESALHKIERLITARQQTLTANLDPALPPVAANPALLERVLLNLFSNASKYTPEGGQIAVQVRPMGNGQVQITVSDNGQGIPGAAIPHLFDRFYRAPGSETVAAGTGLGLSIVKSIVEMHQGRIWVNSTPGVGSAFTFTLPTHP